LNTYRCTTDFAGFKNTSLKFCSNSIHFIFLESILTMKNNIRCAYGHLRLSDRQQFFRRSSTSFVRVVSLGDHTLNFCFPFWNGCRFIRHREARSLVLKISREKQGSRYYICATIDEYLWTSDLAKFVDRIVLLVRKTEMAVRAILQLKIPILNI